MKVLVTGATGFTGRRVTASLLRDGHLVRCLVRPGSDRGLLDGPGVEFVSGDLGDGDSLRSALRGMDALMNVASLGFGHGPGVVEAAVESGVCRAVFFSTTAVFTSLPARSRAVRLEAEAAVRDSTLDYVLLRPTMIYGDAGDRNVERLLRAAVRYPFLPVVGSGAGLVQPVLVDDLAAAAARALVDRRAVRRTYDLPGAEAISFREFVEGAARAVGRPPRILRIPAPLALLAVALHAAVAVHPALRPEQVRRLLEDKDFDPDPARRDIGFTPLHPLDGLRLEAFRLGLRRAP